jgi:6-phosphofructokinase 1
MALFSCRCKLAKEPDEVYRKILDTFHKYSINVFFYIGGNDSMDTVAKLNRYFSELNEDIKVVGVPKTIDNDLPETDHTPGFGSAAKFVAVTMSEIALDSSAYNLPSVTVVEIMGRHAGWLTASAALARKISNGAPQIICLPEMPFETEDFLNKIRESFKTEKNIVVAVAEGVKTPEGEFLSETTMSGKTDAFGHKYISGAGKILEGEIREKIGCKVRSIELNVLQRCSSHLCSETDIKEAEFAGKAAFNEAVNGKTGVVEIIKRVSNKPYSVTFETAAVEKIANKEKTVPKEWITKYDVKKEMTDYLYPLIQGEEKSLYKDGLPKFFSIR